MPTTIRDQWLNALKNRLATKFSAVMYGVPTYVPENLPACTLWDDADEGTKQEYGHQEIETEIMVEAFEAAAWGTGTEAERYAAIKAQGQEILGQVIKTVTGSDLTLGGLCDDIRYATGAVQYPDDGEDLISAGARFRVRWTHKLGDPYTRSLT
jgi:hypothetical protein